MGFSDNYIRGIANLIKGNDTLTQVGVGFALLQDSLCSNDISLERVVALVSVLKYKQSKIFKLIIGDQEVQETRLKEIEKMHTAKKKKKLRKRRKKLKLDLV